MTKRNPMRALAYLALPTALLLLSVPAQADPFQGGGEGGQSYGPPPQATGYPHQGGGPGQQGGMRQGGGHSQMMQQLGLSQEQREKIKGIMQQGRSQSQALHQQLKTKHQALMQYLQSPDATESKARSLNAEINDLQRQLSELRLKTWFGMRSQLTPDQIQKLNQMKSSMGSHGLGGGRRFGDGQNGPQNGFGGNGRGRMMGPQMQQQGQYGGPGGNNGGYGPGPDAGFAPPAPGFNNRPNDNQPGYGPQNQPMGGMRIGDANPDGPDADMPNNGPPGGPGYGPPPEHQGGPAYGPPPDNNDEGPDLNL